VRKRKECLVPVACLTTDGKAGVEADDPRGGNFCSQAHLYMVPGTFILLTFLILAFLQLYSEMHSTRFHLYSEIHKS
jgi:hypothetical protein